MIRRTLAAVVIVAVSWVSTASAETAPHAIDDQTGEVLPLLANVYTPDELAAPGAVTVAWLTSSDDYSAIVPYVPIMWPECSGALRCILIRESWWTSSGWQDQAGADQVLAAHEFAHVLSLDRKRIDPSYRDAVKRVDEECLADAVAAHVLDRAGLPGTVTEGYNVAYQCEDYWRDTFGESRAEEAAALAADLLVWAGARQAALATVEIDSGARASAGAVRQAVEQ